MRDCGNGEMRDLLPELLHNRLPSDRRAVVQAHVDGCADCRAELIILRQVIAIGRTAPVDVTRIAAALPAYRARSAWHRAAMSPAGRIAAAILLLVGGAVVAANVVGRARAPAPVQRTAEMPAANAPTVGPAPVPAPRSGGATAEVAARPAAGELAVGESFHDLSDAQLRTLIDELGKLEAVPSAETEAVAPSLGRGGE